MRKNKKRVLSGFLAVTMLTSLLNSSLAFSSSDYEEPQEAEVVTTEAPAPETQAPETQAPETQAPETQAPITEAQTQEAESTPAETVQEETTAPAETAETTGGETAPTETSSEITASESEDAESETEKKTEKETETETETETEVRKNIVTFKVDEGAVVTIDNIDITKDTKEAKEASKAIDGKIVFKVAAKEGYEITKVLVDETADARKNEETVDEPDDYIIEGILTDNTIVTVKTDRLYPQQEFTADKTGNGVVVAAAVDEGVFPYGTTMRVKDVSAEYAIEKAQEALDDKTVVDAAGVDITFYDAENNEIQPKDDSKVSVIIKWNESVEGDEFSVVHVQDDGTAEKVEDVTTATETTAEFEADSFSVYIVSGNSETKATVDNLTVPVNGTITLTSDLGTNYRYHRWVFGSSGNNTTSNYARIAYNNGGTYNNDYSRSVTVTGIRAGTVVLRHQYSNGDYWQNAGDSINLTVAASQIVQVGVYVAGSDTDNNKFSGEMLTLLNVKQLNNSGYYSAGTVEIDLSKLSGNKNSKIQTLADWEYVLGQLRTALNTSASNSDPNNLIGQYIDQIIKDLGKTQGKMYSGMWVSRGTGEGITGSTKVDGNGTPTQNGTNSWHLDLRFDTVRIDYIYGNNGITTGNTAIDGTTAGSKVFIKGAKMDFTPTIKAPDGYKIIGYYSDPECTDGNEWNAVGDPIEENTKVYIKIVPKNNVVINYKVQEGKGTVTDPSNNNAPVQNGMEHFNPTTGAVKGSTAEPADNWEFEGWYSDENLNTKVSSDRNYKPSTPRSGWPEGGEYTYYAKFVRKKTSLTIEKQVEGNMGDKKKPFNFTVTCMDGNEVYTLSESENGTNGSFSLMDDGTQVINNIPVGATITVKENILATEGYSVAAIYNNGNISKADTTFTVSSIKSADNNKIIVTNSKSATPDTGLDLSNAPYLTILSLLALIVFGGFGFCFRRRRRL